MYFLLWGRMYCKRKESPCHTFYNVCVFSSFFVTKKNYLMLSLAMSVRPSVRPSSVEISLERGSKRSAKPIDLKIGLDMDN